ncbi:MAG TPA: hypothetical protein VMH90_01435 [Thermoplasmata archaeon]|nr:hypothetical protein [Thermoplasmata archaeon]
MPVPVPPTVRPGSYARLKAFLSAHPILCLALLTPGIPEYLSGSSSPVGLLGSPLLFLLLLCANLGLYLAGVLLIRETRVRWQLGWASVLALGVAYGIAEEGLALDTLFDPTAGPVSAATAFHAVGVNWGWTSQILVFHALFSVALPLLLLELALPAWRGRSLLTTRGIYWTAAAYLATIGIAGTLIARYMYWMGAPVFVGSLAAIGGLVLLARALPADAVRPLAGRPRESPARLFLLGLATFPAILVVPALLAALGLPGLGFVLIAPGIAVALLAVLVRNVGTDGAEPGVVAYTAGLIVPVAALGFLVALRFPPGLFLVGGVDVIAFGFLWKLYRRYAPSTPGGGPRAWPMAG